MTLFTIFGLVRLVAPILFLFVALRLLFYFILGKKLSKKQTIGSIIAIIVLLIIIIIFFLPHNKYINFFWNSYDIANEGTTLITANGEKIRWKSDAPIGYFETCSYFGIWSPAWDKKIELAENCNPI